MKILIVGAAGVLGRAVIPHLAGHEVVGTTRDPARLAIIAGLGATGVVCDVYQPEALDQVARAAAPEIVVNLMTDLAGGSREANARVRREGGPVVVRAARAAGARRLVVESIAFAASGEGAAAVAELEAGARASGLEALVLRFGRLWGPGTWSPSAPEAAPTIHVETAGRLAAPLILAAPPGTYDLAG
ncbi:MAG TPA: NAD-dependent epimerase/dehydratase family protein [Polyangia bacterium]